MGLDVRELRRIPALLALWALLATAPVEALADVEVYHPAHRPANELAALAAPLLAPDGVALVDPQTGAVLLRGDEIALKRVLEVLRSLDLAPVQFRIESEMVSLEALRGMGIAASGWIRVGDLSIGRLAVATPTHPRRGSSVAIEARTYRTTRSESFAGQIVVAEGRTAELWTGTSYPILVRELEIGHRDRRVIETLPQLEVRSGFQVRPRSLGDGGIELEITPVRASRRDGGAVQETGAATLVRVQPGEQLAIASVSRRDEGESAELLARGSYGAESEDVMLVRATPLEAPAATR